MLGQPQSCHKNQIAGLWLPVVTSLVTVSNVPIADSQNLEDRSFVVLTKYAQKFDFRVEIFPTTVGTEALVASQPYVCRRTEQSRLFSYDGG
jgi:hypothetical protein